jgi:hypothetical protein
MQGIQGPKKSLERRIQGPRVKLQVHVSPTLFLGRAGDKTGWAETPYPPPQGIPLLQVNYPSGTSLSGNLASASKSGSEVIVLTKDNLESISILMARLYEVRQLSWRPAQVTHALITTRALEEIRPGWYNQNTFMAGQYRAKVDIRRTIVPHPHSASTLGGDHTSRHIEKKDYQRDQRKNRLL